MSTNLHVFIFIISSICVEHKICVRHKMLTINRGQTQNYTVTGYSCDLLFQMAEKRAKKKKLTLSVLWNEFTQKYMIRDSQSVSDFNSWKTKAALFVHVCASLYVCMLISFLLRLHIIYYVRFISRCATAHFLLLITQFPVTFKHIYTV